MARYEALGDLFSNQRLGSFEAERFGSGFGSNGDPGFDTNLTASVTGTPPAAASGSAAVMQGIGAILAPLAEAGVGIYAASQQASLQKAQLKAQARAAAQQPVFQQPMYMPPPPKKSPAGAIIAILGGMTVLAVVLVVVLKKKK